MSQKSSYNHTSADRTTRNYQSRPRAYQAQSRPRAYQAQSRPREYQAPPRPRAYQAPPRRQFARPVCSFTNFLAAFVGVLFIFCVSVTATLNLRQIYYRDIRANNLVAVTGMSEEAIKANYDTLIDYNLITKGIEKLEFPDFPMSEHGEIHFAEVKRIFIAIQYMAFAFGAIYLMCFVVKLRRRDYGFLRLTAILSFVTPLILGSLAAINWMEFFVKFHQIFFSNNYWIFDPAVDPVINILPDSFFLHCVIVILVLVVIGCILCDLLYRILRSRR